MSHLPFHQQQLDFITRLAAHRIEFLNPFFKFVNYFDSNYFYFCLISIIWLGFSYQWGLRIYYWATSSYLINTIAKYLIDWPRPSTDLPEVGLFHFLNPGFPSGGAQTCLLLGGILIYHFRTKTAWAVALFYIFLVSFSRLYLGVHYPIDILGGWFIGAVLLGLFIWVDDPLERWLIGKGAEFCLALSLLIPLAILFVIPFPGITYSMFWTIGIGSGTYISLKYHLFSKPPQSVIRGIGRGLIGAMITAAIVLAWPSKDSPLQSLTAGIFMSFAASPLTRWLIR